MWRSTAKVLELTEAPPTESHFGVVVTLAAFAVLSSVCSAVFSLAVLH